MPELADAIVELTETGSSLRANRLRIVSTLLESTPRLVAHAAAWADTWKREKLENLALLLRGALQASGKVGLKMNLPGGQAGASHRAVAGPAHPHDLASLGRRLDRY